MSALSVLRETHRQEGTRNRMSPTHPSSQSLPRPPLAFSPSPSSNQTNLQQQQRRTSTQTKSRPRTENASSKSKQPRTKPTRPRSRKERSQPPQSHSNRCPVEGRRAKAGRRRKGTTRPPAARRSFCRGSVRTSEVWVRWSWFVPNHAVRQCLPGFHDAFVRDLRAAARAA